MKGFIIACALVVGLIVVGITQVSNISLSFYDKAQQMEGGTEGKDAFERLKVESPEEFRKKYDEPFQQRLWICKATYFLAGDEVFKTVGESTRALYLGTPFDTEDGFAVMLHRLAKVYEDRQPDVYYHHLKEIVEHFPNSSIKDDVDRQYKLIKIRLNIGYLRPQPTIC